MSRTLSYSTAGGWEGNIVTVPLSIFRSSGCHKTMIVLWTAIGDKITSGRKATKQDDV